MDSVSDNTAGEEAPRSPGAILAAERERQGLSRADIAQRLHMSVSQVEALEVADYARLPQGTFLRGFTRNYARALGLDPEALVGLLARDAPRESSPRIVVPSQNIRFDPLGARLANPYVKAAGIAAAVILFAFAAMYWWLFVRPQGVASQVAVKKPAVEAAKPQSLAVPVPAPAAEAAREETPPGEPAAAPAASASRPPPEPPAPRSVAPGEGVISLAFKGAAWVEIVDARGRTLVSRTHAAGSGTEIAGKPPFNVVIGNAPDVRLTYNGRAVDLDPHTRVAVARFTLQ